MQKTLLIETLPGRTRSSCNKLLPTLCFSVLLLVSCRSNTQPIIEPGTFLNPPKVGERIIPGVSSVVCFDELDAIGMVRTGFFTASCERMTGSTSLMAESIVTRDAGEGPVLLVKTTYKEMPAWVPIPWHDWI